MQAGQVLDRLLRKICPDMHKLRRTALFVNVMAPLHGAVLTVTHLGRAISSGAKEKRCIKRADRLLSNRRLQRERLEVTRHSPDSLSGASNARCSRSIGPIWTNASFPTAWLASLVNLAAS